MDHISSKIIKYGGKWNTNVYSLSKNILVSDTSISIKSGSASINIVQNDVISLIIGGYRFICKYKNNTLLTIVSSDVRTTTIDIKEPIKVLEHITSRAPEDLVTNFELNKISVLLDNVIISVTTDVSGTSSGQIDLTIISSFFETTISNIDFYIVERIGNTLEHSVVDYNISSNILYYESMTTIPSGVGIISFLPSSSKTYIK